MNACGTLSSMEKVKTIKMDTDILKMKVPLRSNYFAIMRKRWNESHWTLKKNNNKLPISYKASREVRYATQRSTSGKAIQYLNNTSCRTQVTKWQWIRTIISRRHSSNWTTSNSCQWPGACPNSISTSNNRISLTITPQNRNSSTRVLPCQ